MIRREMTPALAASLVLHIGVAVILLVSWRFTRDLQIGTVVPVNIVTNASVTDLAEAVQAPVEQTAQTETPVPDAPTQAEPEPAPPKPVPQPVPKPAPPKPAPTPAPTPTPKPAPTKPAPPKKAEKSFDLDALEASLSKSSKASSAAKGASRQQTATQARPNLGSGAAAAAAIRGLSDELQRRWNPNCDVEGGREVQLRVTFTIGSGGQVVGQARPEIRSANNAVSQAAAERAVRAVYAASPFRSLPRDFYNQSVAVNFNAREACSS